MSVEEGKKAPDFTAATDGGGKLKLSELRGAPVVLYFYPKDDTPGCTTEACGFRDGAAALRLRRGRGGLQEAEGEGYRRQQGQRPPPRQVQGQVPAQLPAGVRRG